MTAVNAAQFPVEDAVKQGLITGTKYSADATHNLRIKRKFAPGETSSSKTKQELWDFHRRVAQAEAKPLSFDNRFCWVSKIFSASGMWDRRRCQIMSLPEYTSAIGAERIQKRRQAGVLEQRQPVVLCIQAYGASQPIIASQLLTYYMCHHLVKMSSSCMMLCNSVT